MARVIWGCLLFLLAGCLGYFVALIVQAALLGYLILDGRVTASDMKPWGSILVALPIIVGFAFAWVAVGRKRWLQWRQERTEADA